MRSSKKISPSNLISNIKDRIRGEAAVIGIGNILRGDDGAGPKFIELLKKKKVVAHLFDCGTAPENYIFPILSSGCDTVILVDAADFKARPGEIRVFDLDEISKVSFSTHSLSPILLIDLLKTGRDGLNIFFVSIQPKATSLGGPLSNEVKKGLSGLADIFIKLLA